MFATRVLVLCIWSCQHPSSVRACLEQHRVLLRDKLGAASFQPHLLLRNGDVAPLARCTGCIGRGGLSGCVACGVWSARGEGWIVRRGDSARLCGFKLPLNSRAKELAIPSLFPPHLLAQHLLIFLACAKPRSGAWEHRWSCWTAGRALHEVCGSDSAGGEE